MILSSFQDMTERLQKLNFKQSQHDYSLFTRRTSEGTVIILVYVDNLLVIGVL